MRKRVLMIRTIVLMMSKWVITGKRVVKLSSQSRSMTCGRPAADSRLEASRLSDLDRHFPMHGRMITSTRRESMKHMKRWACMEHALASGTKQRGAIRLGYGIAWAGLALLTPTLWWKRSPNGRTAALNSRSGELSLNNERGLSAEVPPGWKKTTKLVSEGGFMSQSSHPAGTSPPRSNARHRYHHKRLERLPLGERTDELLPRVLGYYTRLCALPRRTRRALVRHGGARSPPSPCCSP